MGFFMSNELIIIAALGATILVSLIAQVWQWLRARNSYQQLLSRHEQVVQQNGALKQQIQMSEQHHHEKIALIEQSKNKLSEQLAQLAAQQQRQGEQQMRQTLSPLHEQLQQFRQRVDLLDKQNTHERASLLGQIKQLHQLNQQLSQDAQQLSSALIGDQKKQGDWGELVLQRVLEASGLTDGREFTLQNSFAQDGKQRRPDAIIHLPEDKHLIIDAKVSLVAWHRYQETGSAEDSKALRQSIRAHIDDLSKKDYSQLTQLNSPDFVLLFFAVEPALQHALNEDPQLFDYAASKQVLLTTPSSLLVNLKTAASLWQLSKQNENAQNVIQQGNKLYDKLRSFIDHLQRVGAQIGQAQSSYQQAMRGLTSGPGNVLQQAETLVEMGIRPKQKINSQAVQQSVQKCDTIPE